MFHISIWGGLELCLGGLAPLKHHGGDWTIRSVKHWKSFMERASGQPLN